MTKYFFIILLQNQPIKIASKTYACPFCPKIMEHKANMERHIMTHSNQRPFVCTFCGAAFKRKSSWQDHTLRIHEDKLNVEST